MDKKDILTLLGLGLVSLGFYMIYAPLAPIAVGSFILYAVANG